MHNVIHLVFSDGDMAGLWATSVPADGYPDDWQPGDGWASRLHRAVYAEAPDGVGPGWYYSDQYGWELAIAVGGGWAVPTASERLSRSKEAARAIVASERSRRIDLLVAGKVDDWRGHMRTTAGGSALLALVALGAASEAQEDALVATLELFERVEAHEAAEALIVADIAAATTVEQLQSIMGAISTDARWPA